MGTGTDRPAEIREEGQTNEEGEGGGSGRGDRDGDAEEEEGVEDENFRRLFAAIDFDPSRTLPSSSAPPQQPAEGNDSAGPVGWGGWLAVSLNLRASEVSSELIDTLVASIQFVL